MVFSAIIFLNKEKFTTSIQKVKLNSTILYDSLMELKTVSEENSVIKSDVLSQSGILKNQLNNEEMQNVTLQEALEKKKLYEQETGFVFRFAHSSLIEPMDKSFDLINYLKIDLGEQDGIKKNSAVMDKNGLIGVVYEVYPTSSKVQLINDLNNNITKGISAKAKNRDNSEGIISETFNDQLVMSKIDSKDIEKGDIVETTGLGGVFPKQLKIGYIDKVLDSSNDLLKTAYIKIQFNPRDISYVFVVENSK
jgi:rod shape-determining protein MreC